MTRTAGLPALTLSALLSLVGATALVPALPSVERHLGIGPAEGTWLLLSGTLAAGIAMVALPRLGDLFGHRRLLALCGAVLVLGAGLCPLSDNYVVWLVGCTLQGVASPGIALAMGFVRRRLTGDDLDTAVGMLSFAYGASSSLTVIFGGLLVSAVGVPGYFWTLTVLGIVAVVVLRAVPAETPPERGPHQTLDLAGMALLVAALWALLLGIGGGYDWNDPAVLTCLALAPILLAAWVLVELRSSDPLIDVRLLASRAAWPALAVSLLLSGGTFGVLVLVPAFSQTPTDAGYGFEGSPAQTAGLLTGQAVAIIGGALAAGRLMGRHGPRRLAACGALLTLLRNRSHTRRSIRRAPPWRPNSADCCGKRCRWTNSGLASAWSG